MVVVGGAGAVVGEVVGGGSSPWRGADGVDAGASPLVSGASAAGAPFDPFRRLTPANHAAAALLNPPPDDVAPGSAGPDATAPTAPGAAGAVAPPPGAVTAAGVALSAPATLPGASLVTAAIAAPPAASETTTDRAAVSAVRFGILGTS
ncbi:MAG: hypothetical protein ACXVLZ_09015 [Acidimicrobiia bacterium]